MKASRSRIVFLLLGVVAVGLGLWAVFGPKKPASTAHASVPVTVAKAAYQDVPVAITAIGAVQAWQSDLIRAQVSGKLLSVPVAEGSFVKAGQLLAQIDPAPFQATLMQAQGALARDQALLANARLDLQRYQALAKTNSISGQQVDTQAALVKQDEGVVMLDQGQVAAAQVNLNYCRIASPVTGRVGVRLTDPGNLVSSTDTTGIIVVNQLSPIAVTFTVPEGDFQRLAAMSDGFRKLLKTQAYSQESGVLLDTGELTVADNRVDPSTGTVQLKARFANSGQKLWPGQFINVRLTLQTLQHVVTVPSVAVNEGPNGAFVYVVAQHRKVQVRPVSVQVTQDQISVIQNGLQIGDTVVTDGQVSLSPGATVAIRDGSSQGGGAGSGKRGRKNS
jgi:multidrug efflux system membrane fusion protein